MDLKAVKDIAAVARDRRKQLGLTQADLASRIGVGREWVIKFEQGKATVELGIVMRALRVLRLRVELHPESAKSATGPDELDAILNATTRLEDTP